MEDGAETRAKTRYHTEPKGKASNSDGALQAMSLIQPDKLQPLDGYPAMAKEL